MNALSFDFMQRAVVACAIIGAVAPLVGGFIVQRGQSLIGDGMGHMAFAGVGLAVVVGVNPLLGALVTTLLAAAALFRLQRGGLTGDLSLALIFYGGIALGFLLASRSSNVSTLLGFLFGSPLNLDWGQVGLIAGLAVAILALIVALYPQLVALAFDEQAARVSGVRTERVALALTLLVALVVVGGMATIGLLLVSALMVVPVAAAAQLASSYRATLSIASAIGAISAVIGLFVAFYGDLSPGASIVLVALAGYMIATGIRNTWRPVAARAGRA